MLTDQFFQSSLKLLQDRPVPKSKLLTTVVDIFLDQILIPYSYSSHSSSCASSSSSSGVISYNKAYLRLHRFKSNWDEIWQDCSSRPASSRIRNTAISYVRLARYISIRQVIANDTWRSAMRRTRTRRLLTLRSSPKFGHTIRKAARRERRRWRFLDWVFVTIGLSFYAFEYASIDGVRLRI